MPTGIHISAKLQAFLAGALAGPERGEAEEHLAACAACADELALLREARALLRPEAFEPRAGFAASVALAARDGRRTTWAWLRWSLGGTALAAAAAVAVAVSPNRVQPLVASAEVRVAQRLDLYEDMAVMQHQQALEDLDVVEDLQALESAQEARP